ncbi:MAG: polysaccharide biosynthesis C-terminal domain-containing protein, partial [Clostridia bacterium]|nr:polysaccharide biosynthesis C-terminal domain-containing protein [Clostridia bacterium]
ADLRQVAVYTIYHMIVGNIRHLVTALTGGMEPLFGDMLAKGEYSLLHKTYRRFELLLAVASTVLFGTAAVMILPFVKLYTAGVTDAEYIQPAFAVVLLLTEAIHCMLLPCTGLPVAANRFKETRWGAYGEALLNIGLSCLLVWWEPLLGVAIGTLLSTLFKGFFYLRYAARHILHVSFRRMLKTYLFRIWLLATIVLGGMWCMYRVPMDHLAAWCLWGVAAFAAVSGITLAAHILCAPRELRQAFRWLATSFLKRNTDSAEALYEEAPDR